MPTRSLSGAFPLAAVAVLLALAAAPPAAAALPDGFADSLVTPLPSPTALAFTPDGRLLMSTQTGSLYVFQNGALVQPAALTFPAASICTDVERGLLGIAGDPAFATNHFIYLYYTFHKPGRTCSGGSINRVSRFVLPAGNAIDPASETILVDNIPSKAGNHNAGDLHFGPDGYLYISVGDSGCRLDGSGLCAGNNNNARFLNLLVGKILRVRSDGTIPPDNPMAGDPTARRCGDPAGVPAGTGPCAEMWAWGLRNPFRFSFRPGTGQFYINDVGQDVWEEIDVSQIGADYGWNVREGHCITGSRTNCPAPPPEMTDPIYDYDHRTGCTGITGGAFVPQGAWPSLYDGVYLFADYTCGKIFRLVEPAGQKASAVEFATGLGASSAVTLIFGPSATGQSLYYTSYANGGEVRRIDFVGSGNRAPTAVGAANPGAGPAPLAVTFDATGSSDPDAGDTLTFLWTFGDGSADVETANLQVNHTYSAGDYTATLRARDNQGALSAPVQLAISAGDSPPVPVISTPADGYRFRVGETLTLTGSATDAQDGNLPASALSWTVIRHHSTHTHPYLGPVAGNNVPVEAPPPEDLAATTNSYLEIRLTATDSHGLQATAVRNVEARWVDLQFATDPPGLALKLNGDPVTGPVTVTSWEGYLIEVQAPQQASGSDSYVFRSWSDGGAATHTIATPAAPDTYTAFFELAAGTDFYTLPPCRLVDTRRPDGPLGGPALGGSTVRTFDPAGSCGVPATAKALAVNLTVIGPTAGGHLIVFPAGTSAPQASVINFQAGQTRANNALVSLGDGGFAVQCALPPAQSTGLLVDVVGYFQ